MELDKLLKRSEVANLLRVSTRTVMRYHDRGLKRYLVNGSARYKLNDVLDFIEKHKKAGNTNGKT